MMHDDFKLTVTKLKVGKRDRFPSPTKLNSARQQNCGVCSVNLTFIEAVPGTVSSTTTSGLAEHSWSHDPASVKL